jgi:alpha-tubulin suppressor-like RCC1 family protein
MQHKSPFLPILAVIVLLITVAIVTKRGPALAMSRPASALDLAPLQNIQKIDAGGYHTCALTTSGSVKCWGYNQHGQLGDGTSTYRLTPVDVVGLSSGVSALAASGDHTCALTTSGGVKCWGNNASGELGDNTTAARLTPVDVVGLSSGVSAIDAGGYHTCALTTNGAVKCWGNNLSGQLGNGATTNSSIPVDVVGLSSEVSAIAVSGFHTCALTTSGSVKCWGDNAAGQLGDGTTTQHRTPVDVVGLGSGVSAVALGVYHSCALINSGGVKCWGNNASGELGDGTTIAHSTPVDVVSLGSGVDGIAAGGEYDYAYDVYLSHTCALTTGGGVKCWGYNADGRVGDGTTAARLTPVDVVGLSSEVRAISAGGYHTCGLTISGGVKCWGHNQYGQLGIGTAANRAVPIDVRGLSSGISAITVGAYHNCALTTAQRASCWGNNGNGRLGDGTTTVRYTPVEVSGLTENLTALTGGGSHTCALTAGAGLKCWGDNLYGQLGDGKIVPQYTPVDVSGLTTGVDAVDAGNEHTCALTTVGGVKCWGNNRWGELGDGTTNAHKLPADVSGLTSNITALAAGSGLTCALTTSGGVKCWGSNTAGELGDGTRKNRYTPVDVIGLNSTITAIAVGSVHACALTTNGAVKCWGSNFAGELGDGTTISRTTPVNVNGLSSSVTAIAAGNGFTCALMTTGSVKCWGYNAYGELGDGTTTAQHTPVDVRGLNNDIVAIATGYDHTYALTSAGAVKCWGGGLFGQLGDGPAWRTTPVDVVDPNAPTPTSTSTPTATPCPTDTGVTQDGCATITPTPTATPTATFTPTSTPLPAPGDGYEDDDGCDRSRLITSDGTMQLHTFHESGDADWVQVQVLAGATYQIEVLVPEPSLADVQLQLFAQCDGNATPHDALGPGLRLRFTASADGAYYLNLTNYDPEVAGAAVAYQLFVRKLEEGPQPGALVVVGGRLRVNDDLQPNIYEATNLVYRLFTRHGYPAERIFYLANDLTLDADNNAQTQDVDGLANRERLQYALTQWATDPSLGLGPDRAFTLYLMDHGDYDKFFLNGRNETVGPDELDQWLTSLETARPGVKVNVMIDACLSGSFIDPGKSLSKAGRVVITSASNDANAYPVREGGTVFTNAFMQALDGDTSLFGAYAEARAVGLAWPFAQSVWLDDNGNGVANEPTDGQVAQQRGFAFAGSLAPTWEAEPPYIAWVQPPLTIANRRGEIRAFPRTASANLDVWAVIYDPTYSPPPPSETLPVDTSRATIRLEDLDKDGVYSGLFAGFDQLGVYRIVVYAVDDSRLQSRPKQALVTVGSQLFLPLVRR